MECHDTGTPTGDPLEKATISKIFGKDRPYDKSRCRLGLSRPIFGHSEGASGVAGLIEGILMLENDMLLHSRNFENSNTKIPS